MFRLVAQSPQWLSMATLAVLGRDRLPRCLRRSEVHRQRDAAWAKQLLCYRCTGRRPAAGASRSSSAPLHHLWQGPLGVVTQCRVNLVGGVIYDDGNLVLARPGDEESLVTARHDDMRASGCMFGLAYGDALGAPTEFLGMAEIVGRYGPGGPRDLTGDPALVTDDTQMTLAVARALREVTAGPGGGPPTPARVEPALRAQFVRWWSSPDNDRAPGATCLRACERLASGMPWRRATVEGSKGCGANMRVAPVGLVPDLDEAQRAGIAQLQAALTHGHPTGLAASELTAFAVHWLCGGMAPADLPAALRDRCADQRRTYHTDWLADLWERPGVGGPAEFIAAGWDECASALDALDAALTRPDRHLDPCGATGAGWVAEEALATALHCFLLFPDDPVAVLARAATTSGDSDSIACLAGAFAGAAYGFDAWPAGWSQRIEHAEELAELGRHWD